MHLAAPDSAGKRVVAVLFNKKGGRLAWIDSRTLRAGKARSIQLGAIDAWAFDRADKRRVVLASTRPPPDNVLEDRLRFVQLRTLRVSRTTPRLGGLARALMWARPNRVVAVIANCCGTPNYTVSTINPRTGRVSDRARLDGVVMSVAHAAGGLILLDGPYDEIAHARLDVVAPDGSVRSQQLDRIRAGTVPSYDESSPIGTRAIPALTLDPNGDHAYVVQAEGPAADVDLRTLAVTYHDLVAPRSLAKRFARWLTPSAEAKGMAGPYRQAVWLGDGLIAVTGSDESQRRDQNGQPEGVSTPAGLAIVDMHDWTIRMLDQDVAWATVASHLLLAGGWHGTDARGIGLVAYGADRMSKFALFPGSLATVWMALAGRAYVKVGARPKLSVVDLTSGRVVGRRPQSLPMPLLGDSP